jgi:hypothetical protein
MVTRPRGTCKSIVSSLASFQDLLIPSSKALRPFFQSRPYCERYSKGLWRQSAFSGVEVHIRSGKEHTNEALGLGMLHSIIGDLLTFESFGLVLTCLAKGTAVCSKRNPFAWRAPGELLRVLALIKLIYAKLISLPDTLSCIGSSKADVIFQVRAQACSLEKIGAKAKMAAVCDVVWFVRHGNIEKGHFSRLHSSTTPIYCTIELVNSPRYKTLTSIQKVNRSYLEAQHQRPRSLHLPTCHTSPDSTNSSSEAKPAP